MGWTKDWLYSLLLNQARDTLAEAVRAADRQSVARPIKLYAMEHTEWKDNCIVGLPVRVWSSEDDFSTLIVPSDVQSIRNSHARRIFQIPVFSWFIEKRKRVLICRHLGPLYANGGWWNVQGQGRSGRLVRGGGGGWIS